MFCCSSHKQTQPTITVDDVEQQLQVTDVANREVAEQLNVEASNLVKELGVPVPEEEGTRGRKEAEGKDDRTDEPPSAASQLTPVHQVLQLTALHCALKPANTQDVLRQSIHSNSTSFKHRGDLSFGTGRPTRPSLPRQLIPHCPLEGARAGDSSWIQGNGELLHSRNDTRKPDRTARRYGATGASTTS
ncbi:hypothetical protein EYF80_010038 [Liparis tanakae]|uniref:Uncharacterized protein n=1 Tax=Liparis tanakae TaxID=230148 RepID=A0A4Z2IQ74_9TELE|nr:hypothetical protein EYF80_010038 [Liparis tanakae]